MQITFYCHLYMNENLKKKEAKIKKKLSANNLQPSIYVIAFSQSPQNQLDFFSSLLLKQHIYENTPLFLVGLADGYDSALELIRQITEEVFAATQSVDIRHYILQKHNESIKENRRCQ